MAEPLVTIGIPTYNRSARLRRAAESVLAQSHRRIELVIADNASSDDTETVCRELCAGDARVRYVRMAVNHGLTANFNRVIDELVGEFVMLLSDDDWLAPSYVEACLAELRARSDHVLVCGTGMYMQGQRTAHGGAALVLDQEAPSERVVSYLSSVDENGLLYGVMSRTTMQRAAPMLNVIGNDWLFGASIVFQGKARTICDAVIFRDLGGTSADFVRLTATLGVPPWQARIPHLVIAAQVISDILWRAPVYSALSAPARLRLALGAGTATIRWRSLVWHITMPPLAALGRRPRGRWLWRAYVALTRWMGAGR